jgi:glutathione peroxidase-family protein
MYCRPVGTVLAVFIVVLWRAVYCEVDSCSSATESCSSDGNMASNDAWKTATSVYDFRAKDIDGNDVSLDKYKGNVVLIVNVACKCGYTDTAYTQMQALYEKYGSDGLRIAAFPSNQFAGQEPWPEPEIKKFVTDKFHATFDLYSKINVNGDGTHPLWNYLKSKQHGTLGDWIKWNFSKFLIDRQGQPIKRYSPTDEPFNFEDDIVKALGVEKK